MVIEIHESTRALACLAFKLRPAPAAKLGDASPKKDTCSPALNSSSKVVGSELPILPTGKSSKKVPRNGAGRSPSADPEGARDDMGQFIEQTLDGPLVKAVLTGA
jgi:hypothetical protein